MRIKYKLIFIFLFCFFQGKAQNKVETTFLRPSITTFYISPSSTEQQKVLSNLISRNSLEARFDEHSVEFDNLILDYPPKIEKVYFPLPPKKPDSTATPRENKLYKIALAEYVAEKKQLTIKEKAYKEANEKRNNLMTKRSSKVQDYIQATAKPVVARWFSRDSDGNMNISLWEERAHYSANDEHVNQSLNSSVSRISTLGEDLMKKSYIVVYDIGNIESYDEIYNEQDRAKRIKEKYLNINFIPVKREKEGYRVSYTRHLYKLSFDENTANSFYEKYWLDESVKDNREEIKGRWETASFPVVKQHVFSGVIEQSQSADEEYWRKMASIKKRRTKEDMLNTLGNNNLNGSLSSLKKTIEDFQLKTSVFKAYPITAKVGSKEGIKLNNRWFIYEIHLDKEGHQIKKRTGWARAIQVADNKAIATGKSPTSTFRQYGGKEAYSGMLMQPKPGGAVSFNIGSGLLSNDQSTSGFVFDMDFRIGNLSKAKVGRGLYMGFGTVTNSFNNINTGTILTNDSIKWDVYDSIPKFDSITFDTTYILDTTTYSINGELFNATDSTGSKTTANGKTSLIYLSFGREFLIGDRGKYFIYPQFGMGIARYKFNTNNMYSPLLDSLSFPSMNSLYSFKTSVRILSVSVGVHLTPMVSLMVKGSIVNKSQYTSNYSSNVVLNSPNTGAESDWGIDKLKGSNSFPIFATLRINL